MRQIPTQADKIIRSFEQCRLTCYDTDGAGVPTIGWGSLHRPDGTRLTRADVGRLVITQEQADAMLRGDEERAARVLGGRAGTEAIAAMTDNQYAAMVDFVFNLGVAGTTIWQVIRARQFDAVPSELVKFVNARQPDGTFRKLSGLVRRRNAEVELWSRDEPGSLPVTAPSSETRVTETPPTPPPPQPTTRSGSFVAVATTAAVSVAGAAAPIVSQVASGVQQVSTAIAPVAARSHAVEHLQSILLVVLAVLSVLALVLLWLRRRSVAPESAALGRSAPAVAPAASQAPPAPRGG